MAGEIKIPLRLWPHPITDANVHFATPSMTNNLWVPGGWRFPDTLAGNLCGCLSFAIPAYINATPAGKIYLDWLTGSSDVANAMKWFVYVQDKQENAFSWDHASWTDDSLSVLDTSNGAWYRNLTSVSLAAATQTSGRQLAVLIRRNKPGDSADQLAAAVHLVNAWYEADEA